MGRVLKGEFQARQHLFKALLPDAQGHAERNPIRSRRCWHKDALFGQMFRQVKGIAACHAEIHI